ncbi:GNAT family N-acetyltransferase [Fusibacter paucivorans]|uniref:GNAT family N-acetyltransferase n=2 Tax=Fusibacter paucivorans TaxID=76009 RepID=A0ABS5PTI6_9FIRM|nr:GNAT family N-acetyltransferase [Fusibacter paucivorans]MBS7528488.1 GNAT family N-acetyltransferase [Fusibacter paucivorans]
MKITDYDAVLDLWMRTQGMGLRSLDDSKEGIEKFLNRNPRTNFIYTDDQHIVGVMMSGHDGRRGYIYHAAVDHTYRNKGIATQLLSHVLAALKTEGIHKVALVAYKDNHLGNAFWQSHGFDVREDLVYRNKSLNDNNL